MKLFIVFAPRFYELPLAIARELKIKFPSMTFCGLTTGSKEIFDGVQSNDDLTITPINWIDDLERRWLSTETDHKKLVEYENILGASTIKRIIIADRQIGTGFVTGITKRKTPIIKITQDHDKLRNYVVGLLDYIFHILKSESPDFVFSYTVAGAPAYALSVVCQHLGIPFLRISSARMKSRFVIDKSTDVQLKSSHVKFKQALDDPEIVSDYIEEARGYLKEFRQKPKKYDASQKIHARYIKQHSLTNIIKQCVLDIRMVILTAIKQPSREIRKPNAYEISVDRFKSNINARNIVAADVFEENPDTLKRPFVYFPLHVNPEASTMVQAPMHTNQLSIIEALAKSIPLSMDLVVKEHIPMLGRRPVEFYNEIKRIPGVRLISPLENGFEFIKRAKLVCSITSTVAWEAILLGRPVLVMGNPYFLGIEQGFLHCPDLTSLPDAVNKALSIEPVDEHRLELYVAAIFASSFDMPIKIYSAGVSKNTVNNSHDTVENICQSLMTYFEQPNEKIT